jgi:hypothetical protein
MEPARSRRARLIVRISVLLLAVPCGWIAWNQATFNFAVVQPRRIYRSGQMPARALTQTLEKYGIKTVLNLRGPNPKAQWYVDERAATLNAGATQVDIPLSSCVWMSRIQLRTLVRVLDRSEYPVLLHCAWGSERTGLASAVAELLRPNGTLDDAQCQLAARFLYVRVGDGRIMAEFLDQYAAWLRSNHLVHCPEAFHRWVDEEYTPGRPNREDWPYDPTPLVIETRPRPPLSGLTSNLRPRVDNETRTR